MFKFNADDPPRSSDLGTGVRPCLIERPELRLPTPAITVDNSGGATQGRIYVQNIFVRLTRVYEPSGKKVGDDFQRAGRTTLAVVGPDGNPGYDVHLIGDFDYLRTGRETGRRDPSPFEEELSPLWFRYRRGRQLYATRRERPGSSSTRRGGSWTGSGAGFESRRRPEDPSATHQLVEGSGRRPSRVRPARATSCPGFVDLSRGYAATGSQMIGADNGEDSTYQLAPANGRIAPGAPVVVPERTGPPADIGPTGLSSTAP